MNVLVDNTGLQNFGACLLKKCSNENAENAVDDFLQMCIQMVFYDKLLDSALIPSYMSNFSDEIISEVSKVDSSIFDAESKHKQISELDKILDNIAIDYSTQIDDELKSCKTIHKTKSSISIPPPTVKGDEEIALATKAIKERNIGLIELLRQKAAENRDDAYFFEITTRKINADGSIMDKIMSFSEKNKTWNDEMSKKILTSLRVASNQVLAEYFSCPYSPAVIRAKTIQGQRDKLVLSMKEIIKLYDKKQKDRIIPSFEVKLPSIENYLLSKGQGNPNDILRYTIDLRNDFSPVREYIRKRIKGMEINEANYDVFTNELKEIAEYISYRLKYSNAPFKRILENAYWVPLIPIDQSGSLSINVPIPKIFSRDLKKCYTAFTEITNKMRIRSQNKNSYRKRLINNCINN